MMSFLHLKKMVTNQDSKFTHPNHHSSYSY